MTKRIASVVTLAALLSASFAGQAEAQQPQERPAAGVTSLEGLLELSAQELPSTNDLAVALLDAGPARAGAFMEAFEKRAMTIGPKDPGLPDLAALSRRIKGVPAVIERALGHAHIPGPMRNGGIAVALEVARRDPRRASVDLVGRILTRADPSDSGSLGTVARRLTTFVARSVDAASCGPDQTAALLRAAPGGLSVNVIDGVAQSRDIGLAAGLLVGLMSELEGRFDPVLLNRVESIARRGSVRLGEQQCAVVRERLDSNSAFLRQEAALAAGAIGDQRAVERLIELLGDDVSSVRDASHASLRALTSMTISADPFRWREWHARQTRWWNTRGQILVGKLDGAPLGELIDLVAEVSSKRLYRSEIAAALLPLLQHGDPRHLEVVLSALVNLRAPSAIQEITRLTLAHDPAVARVAADALHALKAAGVTVSPAPIASSSSVPGFLGSR